MLPDHRNLERAEPTPGGRPVPSRIGRYAVGRLIGTGGMGAVFRVRDLESGAWRAMKVLRSRTACQVARFEAEGLALGRVPHPNVPRLFDSGVDRDHQLHYLVMELADRGSAAEASRVWGALPPSVVASWSVQVLCALASVHAAGITHRDVKPGNLLLSRDGRMLLADFGIANLPGLEPPVADGGVLGTPVYMAPEQRDDPNHASPAVDLYAMGATVYALSTRAQPMGLSEAAPDDPCWDAVPQRLRTVAIRATRTAPADRYATAREMALELAADVPRSVLADHPHLARWLA